MVEMDIDYFNATEVDLLNSIAIKSTSYLA
jgi:hypothetical protein